MGFKKEINQELDFRSKGNVFIFDMNPVAGAASLEEVFRRLDKNYLEIVLPKKQKELKDMISRWANQGDNPERSVATDSE